MTSTQAADGATGYQELVQLFAEWRAFEQPPLRDGVPDYTAATLRAPAQGAARTGVLGSRRSSPEAWPVEQQVDYDVVRAEMNGFDFYLRVLQALGARSGVLHVASGRRRATRPRTKGRRNHAAVELWTYAFPLDAADEKKLDGASCDRCRRCSRRRA